MGNPLLLSLLAAFVVMTAGAVWVVVATFRAKQVHGWSARLRLAGSLWRDWCTRVWYWDSMPARGWYEIISKRIGRPSRE